MPHNSSILVKNITRYRTLPYLDALLKFKLTLLHYKNTIRQKFKSNLRMILL